MYHTTDDRINETQTHTEAQYLKKTQNKTKYCFTIIVNINNTFAF